MCHAKKREAFYNLTQPGDYTVEKDATGQMRTTLICPSCSIPSELSVGVLSEEPLTLSDGFTCSKCFACFHIYEGEIDPQAGTLPPSAQWDGYNGFGEHKYR